MPASGTQRRLGLRPRPEKPTAARGHVMRSPICWVRFAGVLGRRGWAGSMLPSRLLYYYCWTRHAPALRRTIAAIRYRLRCDASAPDNTAARVYLTQRQGVADDEDAHPRLAPRERQRTPLRLLRRVCVMKRVQGDDDGDVDPSATARIIFAKFQTGRQRGLWNRCTYSRATRTSGGSRAPHSGQDAVLISTSRPANLSPRTLLTGCSRDRAEAW